jgi:alginate O-acetyltransferase complex protein AlgJ
MAAIVALAGAGLLLKAQPYTELVPDFDRTSSRAMVRVIEEPTRANLDYAAFIANPIRHNPKAPKFEKPDEAVPFDALDFEGALVSVVKTLDETPLTKKEKARPLAWERLYNEYFWNVISDPGFAKATAKINGEKWADESIGRSYQKVTSAWLHDTDEGTEVWVEVEFKLWADFFEGVKDTDQDGFKEVYGRLDVGDMDPAEKKKAIEWIRGEYTTTPLTRQQINDWLMELASYWYPTYNTDVIETEGMDKWPNRKVKRKIRKQLKDVTVENPTAVMRGVPHKKKIYNVFKVTGLDEKAAASTEASKEPAREVAKDKKMDAAVSGNFKENNARWEKELAAHGGAYDAWAASLEPYMKAQKAIVEKLPEGQLGFEGKGDWLFFGKSLEYLTGGDISDQPKDKNPIPHLVEFKKYLADHDVNMLFVVIPTKAEMYFEHLPCEMPEDKTTIINPYGRKFLRDVQNEGVEVIDLLPGFMDAKTKDDQFDEQLYQHQDTHWTWRGCELMTDAVADRITQYAWFDELDGLKKEYTVRETTFTRRGDIVDRIAEEKKADYGKATLKAKRVYTSEGEAYNSRGRKDAPIMVIGDSFTGVYELVDCKSAGIASHLAQKTGLPVENITSWGGGPLVRNKMLRARKDDLQYKRLVVYVMVARDLYDYAMGWKPLKVK